jgi:hypothetical protein
MSSSNKTQGNTQSSGASASGSAKTTAQKDPTDLFYEVFNKSNIVIILWFLAIYLILSFIIRLTSSSTSTTESRMITITRTFDFLSLSFLLVFLIASYYLKSESEKESIVHDMYTAFTDYIDNPVSTFSVALFLIVFYIVVLVVGIPMDMNKPIFISIIENGAWLLFAIVLIVGFFSYFLNISISDALNRSFGDIWNRPTDASGNRGNTVVSGNTVASSVIIPKKQVFNIANNIYTYDDAQSVCKAFDSRLATYDEIEKSYTDGGEWCNYGWSENQSIYFPTQKATWESLQKTKNPNSCGRPGINGGYIDNPQTRFGVNCYGVKPNPTTLELQYMLKTTPKTPEDAEIDMKVKLFKEKRDLLTRVNGFNKDKWSAY